MHKLDFAFRFGLSVKLLRMCLCCLFSSLQWLPIQEIIHYTLFGSHARHNMGCPFILNNQPQKTLRSRQNFTPVLVVIMANKGHTLFMKVALALHIGRVVQLIVADLGFENRGGGRRGCHRCSSVKCWVQIGHSQAKNRGGVRPLRPPSPGSAPDYTPYIKICFAFHVGCVVHLYTIHGNLPRLKVVCIAHGRKGTRTTHGNLAHFPCWVYRGHGRKGTLYMKTSLAFRDLDIFLDGPHTS